MNLRVKKSAYRVCLLLAVLLLFASAAPAGIPSLSNPNISKVSKRVYALIGDMDIPNENNQGFICNSVFVITDNGVVVVDPGGSVQVGRMILGEIRKRTQLPVTHVINSHHHADHWMGNDAFSEQVPRPIILGHQIMIENAAQTGPRWLKILDDMTKGSTRGTRVVLPEVKLSGGERLSIGGVDFQLFHPEHAHTRGDLAVFIPGEKVLIAGDILFYRRTPGFQDASPLGNAAALQQLKALDVTKVVPGHGPVTDKAGIDYMLGFIELLRKGVTKYMDEGLQDYEIKTRLNMGDYHEMSGFDQRFGITVNRMYLELESRAFD